MVRRASHQGGAGDGRGLRPLHRRIRPRAAAVLPAVRAARTVLQLRLPEGTAFNVTERSAKKAEALLKDDKDISTYTSYVGQGSPRFWLGLNPQLPNEPFAEIVIVARDVEARERIKARLEKAVDDGALTEARVRVDRFNFGPPVGFPVQFRGIGPDAKTVRDIAYRVRDVVKQ